MWKYWLIEPQENYHTNLWFPVIYGASLFICPVFFWFIFTISTVQIAVFKGKTLKKPLHTTCCAANSRQTQLETCWVKHLAAKEPAFLIRRPKIKRPKTELKEWIMDFISRAQTQLRKYRSVSTKKKNGNIALLFKLNVN